MPDLIATGDAPVKPFILFSVKSPFLVKLKC